MRISLIIATIDRPRQVGELLDSLTLQTLKADEVIVVDQSADDATQDVVERYVGSLPLTYVRDGRKGGSRGRNLGFTKATGEIVAFPDDDCVYQPDVLERVHSAFSSDSELAIYCGISITPQGVPSQGRWATRRCVIDRYNVWTTQTLYTTFYRAEAFRRAGLFNEDLGVGSGTIWGAGEETELMLRALRGGVKAVYDPSLKIMHPEPLATLDQAALDRGRRYNRGFGRVMRMENYPLWFVAYMSGRPLVGAAAALLKGRRDQARYRFVAFQQRLRGWGDA